MHARLYLAISAAILLCPQARAQMPLTGDLGIHDPSAVIRAGSTYFVYATGGGFKTSKDRMRWSQGSRVFTADPAWWKDQIPAPERPALWAGDIVHRDGTYWFYYSVSAWMNFHSCVGLATNSTLDPADPAYRWVDKGVVIDSARGGAGGKGRVNVIDPNLFEDTDGKAYLNYGSYQGGLRQIRIEPATGLALENPPKPVTLTTGLGEAAFMIRAGDWYYFTCSRGKCCAGMESTYQVVYGRARSPQGPFLTKNGSSMLNNAYEVLLSGDANHPGQGGQSFFRDRDSLFMVYHSYTAPDGKSLLNIRPVYQDPAGWLTLDPAKGTVIRDNPSVVTSRGEGRRVHRSGGARTLNAAGRRQSASSRATPTFRSNL